MSQWLTAAEVADQVGVAADTIRIGGRGHRVRRRAAQDAPGWRYSLTDAQREAERPRSGPRPETRRPRDGRREACPVCGRA